mmetsp:Transcript_10210/g.42946  ORF Transcript_10210/g.42946 Transcript_10210/m.42946 type:complete len:214 (+) Transcript_10210:3164-3805(+)
MPAVSRSVTGTPATVIEASTTSRVVPATSVTIALSDLDHALSNELFPAFGLPTRATTMPVSLKRHRSAVSNTAETASCNRRVRAATVDSSSGSSSSSKSNRASSSARSSTASARAFFTGPASPPLSAANAPSAAALVRALTKPCTASACVRSRRPFRNARSVNSPGRARRTRRESPERSPLSSREVFLSSSASTLCTHTEPPCAWISTTSSVV